MIAPVRRRLPARRRCTTYKAIVGGVKVFFTTGEYEDGTLGEVFIDLQKEGATLGALMNCFAILVSICLQHGVPLSRLVERFTGVTFEPSGPVQGHPTITEATSLVDYVFRALDAAYPEQQP
jgi:ribonucleoside-diphosphate reductase alpha chain